MSNFCNKQGCKVVGNKHCGACGAVSYCSVDCQKGDWKVQEISCVNLDKLPTAFVKWTQINKVLEMSNIRTNALRIEGKYKDAIKLLKKVLVIMEHQFGVEIEGTQYYRRSDGEQVDSGILVEIRTMITNFDLKCIIVNDSGSQLAFAIETRRMLEHRNKSEVNTLLLLSDAERSIAMIYGEMRMLYKVEHHCEQSLLFARLAPKGEGQISREYQALKSLATFRGNQSRQAESFALCEEGYILLSGAYGPVHREVQGASIILIDRLLANKEHSRAEDYCRMNYDNVIDPRNGMHQEGETVTMTIVRLATIWLQKPPVDDEKAASDLGEEAEKLSRKAWRIMNKRASDTREVVKCCDIFGSVLIKRGKHTDETRVVLERSLAYDRLQPTFHFPSRIYCLQRLVHFHDVLCIAMPAGDAKDKAMLVRDGYFEELELLRMIHG